MGFVESKIRTSFSLLMIAAVGFITYLPSLKIQFLDGWWYLEWAAKYSFTRYLIQFLDPANITQGYRPVQGMYIFLLFNLFGYNPDGYHLAQNLLHAANAVLLFLLVWKLGKLWRIAFVAAIIYVVLPNYTLAVFWHAVVDPLAAFFYLLTILLWTRFLDSPTRLNYAIAFIGYVLALLSKEIAVFLPLWLFLIEWWFYHSKPNLRVDVPRYVPFVLAWIPYLYQVVQVQSHGEFVGQFGFRIGPHMLGNLIPYMAVLAFPWSTEMPAESIYYVWLAVVAAIYFGVMIWKRSQVLLFLGMLAVFNIAPLLGFPLDYFNTRYLYLSTVTSAILVALVFELLWRHASTHKVMAMIVSAGVVLVVLLSSARVADAAASLAEYTRQLRVPFHDIAIQHPSYPEDSYIYFVYSPLTPLSDLQGLFMTRYGLGMPVSGTEDSQQPGLRGHTNTFVYYFDDSNRPREIVVDRNATTRVSTALPISFNDAISLESIEVVNPTVKRGDPLILLLYWRLDHSTDKDYTVFVHLTDAKGALLAQYDGMPRRGNAPTSQWKLNQPVVDARLLPLSELEEGTNYNLEIGLYDPLTMQRLLALDALNQQPVDKVSIGPISIR